MENSKIKESGHNVMECELTKEYINDILDYREGKLYWKDDRSRRVKAGDRAGMPDKDGYIIITISGNKYRRSRLVYIMHKGKVPILVDHKNTIVNDDRIENLRECTVSQNAQNTNNNNHNTKGVGYDYRYDKPWRARLVLNKKIVFLERFYEENEAIEAVREARLKYHMEFANHGEVR